MAIPLRSTTREAVLVTAVYLEKSQREGTTARCRAARRMIITVSVHGHARDQTRHGYAQCEERQCETAGVRGSQPSILPRPPDLHQSIRHAVFPFPRAVYVHWQRDAYAMSQTTRSQMSRRAGVWLIHRSCDPINSYFASRYRAESTARLSIPDTRDHLS